MPDTSKDPVDHARTTRQHAGETMKAGINAPGLIAVGVGVLSFVVALFSFANGSRTTGIVGVVAAVVLIGAGLAWVLRAHRKVLEKERDWHRKHPDAHHEPPTS